MHVWCSSRLLWCPASSAPALRRGRRSTPLVRTSPAASPRERDAARRAAEDKLKRKRHKCPFKNAAGLYFVFRWLHPVTFLARPRGTGAECGFGGAAASWSGIQTLGLEAAWKLFVVCVRKQQERKAEFNGGDVIFISVSHIVDGLVAPARTHRLWI